MSYFSELSFNRPGLELNSKDLLQFFFLFFIQCFGDGFLIGLHGCFLIRLAFFYELFDFVAELAVDTIESLSLFIGEFKIVPPIGES